MINWYHGLRGWELFFATIGGVFLTFFLVTALAVMLARWVFASLEHDRQVCGCVHCQNYREQAWRKRYGETRD